MEHINTELLDRLHARLDAQERELVTLRATLAGIGEAPSPAVAPGDERPAPKRSATRRGVLKGAGALVFTTALLATGEVVPVAPVRAAARLPARPSGPEATLATAADTLYQTFVGTDFLPDTTSQGAVGLNSGQEYGGGPTHAVTTGAQSYTARLNLPQGATIVETTFYVTHFGGDSMSMSLAGYNADANTNLPIGSTSVPLSSFTVQAISLPITAANAAVDNAQHSYLLEWLASAASITHALYGVRVGYTLPGGAQVYGSAQAGIGVSGLATTGGTGVQGQADLAGGTGVKGLSAAGFPVIGSVTGATNTAAGVLGSGTKGPGVQGQSTGGHGLVGTTNDGAGHAGLIGNANTTGGIGLMGIAPNYGQATVGHAGEFYGNVKITGGTFSAPAVQTVVPHTGDNSYRALHGVASPESWFEDFGKGTLAGGKADVKLDPDFAALVDTSTLLVFLTAYGPQQLHVTQQSGSGFTVNATQAAPTGGGLPPPEPVAGTFAWRVVGKRKDIAGARLAKVAAPSTPPRPAAIAIPESPDAKPPATKP